MISIAAILLIVFLLVGFILMVLKKTRLVFDIALVVTIIVLLLGIR